MTERVRPIEEYFFSGGFPDLTAMMQIVPFGKTYFNKQTHMFLGRDDEQQRDTWDKKQIRNDIQARLFQNAKNQFRVFEKLNNQDKTIDKLVKYYFYIYLLNLLSTVFMKL